MPLYKHTSGERVRTVADSDEDVRLSESESWERLDAPAAKADADAKGAPAKGETKTGRGTAQVTAQTDKGA